MLKRMNGIPTLFKRCGESSLGWRYKGLTLNFSIHFFHICYTLIWRVGIRGDNRMSRVKFEFKRFRLDKFDKKKLLDHESSSG